MTRPPLPPLPTLTDLTASASVVLAHAAAHLAARPVPTGRAYEDSPYVHVTASSEETP